MEFDHRSVIVTGAAGHLGRAVAAVLAARGSRLVLVDRDEVALASAFGRESRHLLLAADLLELGQAKTMLRAAAGHCGRIDALCHLVGGFRMGPPVHETPAATWDFLFDINARTFVNVAHAVVPHMLANGGGRIVAVGAAAGARGLAAMGAYCASKSALIRLVEAMSAELRERHVNVNGVLPTVIDTPENRAAMPDVDPSRWVEPAALAEVIAFLASDAARAMHGAALPVSGLS